MDVIRVAKNNAMGSLAAHDYASLFAVRVTF